MVEGAPRAQVSPTFLLNHSCPDLRGPRNHDPSQKAVSPMTSLLERLRDFPPQSPSGVRPSTCPLHLSPALARSPPHAACTSSRSGSLSGMSAGTSPQSPPSPSGMVSWLLRLPGPGPGHDKRWGAEGCGAAPRGVRSARRPLRSAPSPAGAQPERGGVGGRGARRPALR